MSTCLLDFFPVEILHIILDYLWAPEIFYSFVNISNYIDSILLNYNHYFLNFQSILKKHFDLVCRYIQPYQVISLTLSDSNDTPRQSQLFLSLFSMNQYTRLRALRLIEIDDESQMIFSNLHTLENLISLEFEFKFYVLCHKFPPKIKRLILNDLNGNYLNNKISTFNGSLLHLQHLTLPYCSYTQLRQILYEIPTLRSLKTTTTVSYSRDIHELTKEYQDSSFDLTCLILSISTSISRVHLERFLSHLPHLQQLELVCLEGDRNLCSAFQWEKFIIDQLPSLSIFNFKFQFQYNNLAEDILLASFRSSFWLNESRHWYVACDRRNSLLYTVPRFAPQTIVYPHVPVQPNVTTLPIEQHTIFYDHITELTLNSDSKSLYKYRQVKMLTLLSFDIDKNIVDLTQVQCLSVQILPQWSLQELIQFIKLSMPCLHSLKFERGFIRQSSTSVVPLTQIRTLYLCYVASFLENDLIDLCHFFPHVERLTATVKTRHHMTLLIDRFEHLSSSSFYVVNCRIGVNKNVREPLVTPEWLINNTQRLVKKTNNNNFTCRFDRGHSSWFHLWIGNDDEQQNKQSNMSLNDREEEEEKKAKNKGWWQSCLFRCSLK